MPLAQPAQTTEVDPAVDTTSLLSNLYAVIAVAPLFFCRYDGPIAGSYVSLPREHQWHRNTLVSLATLVQFSLQRQSCKSCCPCQKLKHIK